MDPVCKPTAVALEDAESRNRMRSLKTAGAYEEFASSMREIRRVDLRMVDLSDFIIVLIDLDIQMCGTYEEVFLSNRQKKPALVVCKQGKPSTPNWLLATLPPDHIFGTFDDLKDYLDHVDTADEVETYGRWVFFDQQKLYTPTVLERLLHLHAGVDATPPKNAVGDRSDLSLPLSV